MRNGVCLCVDLCFETHLHASNVKLPGAKLATVHLKKTAARNVYFI